MEVWCHSFFCHKIEVSDQSHASAALPLWKKTPGTHWRGDWLGPRVRLHILGEEKKYLLFVPGFQPRIGSSSPTTTTLFRLLLAWRSVRFYPIIRPIIYVLCEVLDFGQSYSEGIVGHRTALFLYYAFILCTAYHLCFKELNVLRAIELRLSAALDTRTSAKYCYAPERCRVSSVNFLIIRSAQSYSCTPTWTSPFFLSLEFKNAARPLVISYWVSD